MALSDDAIKVYDDHVSWRSPEIIRAFNQAEAEAILGLRSFAHSVGQSGELEHRLVDRKVEALSTPDMSACILIYGLTIGDLEFRAIYRSLTHTFRAFLASDLENEVKSLFDIGRLLVLDEAID